MGYDLRRMSHPSELFERAVHICSCVWKVRMYTLAEIENNCAGGTSCGFEYEMAWVSDVVPAEAPVIAPSVAPTATKAPVILPSSIEPSNIESSSEPRSEPCSEPSSEPSS